MVHGPLRASRRVLEIKNQDLALTQSRHQSRVEAGLWKLKGATP